MRQIRPIPPNLQRNSKQSLVIALVITILLSACGASGVPLEAKVLEPVMNANFKVGDSIKITGRATGSNVKKIELHINGAMFAAVDQPARDNEFEISVDYPPQQAVTTIILVKGVNEKGEAIVTSDPVIVNVTGEATAPPPEPTQPPAAVQPTVPAPTQASQPTAAAGNPTAVATAASGDAAPAPTTAAAAPAGASVSPSGEFANVRTGPGVAYDRVGQINAGQSMPVKGKNADGTWYQVAFTGAPNGVAWVYNEVVKFSGDASKLTVQQAPPAPTAAPQAAQPVQPAQPVQVVPLATAPPAAPPTPNVPPSALLPYQQSDLFFEPRNHLDFEALRPGEQTAATVTVNGATKLEIQIDGSGPPGIYDCPAGNTGAVTPQDAAGKRVSLPVPNPKYPFSISARGYYLVTIFVTKLDGSTTTIPRGIAVDCFKKPGT